MAPAVSSVVSTVRVNACIHVYAWGGSQASLVGSLWRRHGREKPPQEKESRAHVNRHETTDNERRFKKDDKVMWKQSDTVIAPGTVGNVVKYQSKHRKEVVVQFNLSAEKRWVFREKDLRSVPSKSYAERQAAYTACERAGMRLLLTAVTALNYPQVRPHAILHIKQYKIRNICKVSLLCSALYAKCPYYLVLYYMQSVLTIYCFICKVSLLCSVL